MTNVVDIFHVMMILYSFAKLFNLLVLFPPSILLFELYDWGFFDNLSILIKKISWKIFAAVESGFHLPGLHLPLTASGLHDLPMQIKSMTLLMALDLG